MGPSSRIDDLRRRIEHDPASIAFAQLAEEYRRAGQLAEAVETCRAGLQTHPDYSSARITLGRALLALGRLEEASIELQGVVDEAPDHLAAIRALAEARRRQGRVRESLALFVTARSIAPNDPDLERVVIDLTQTLALEGDAQLESSSPSDDPTLVTLERWLEAIHAVRAETDS